MIEILPALPKDHFPRGALRGALARGGITVDELRWDLAAKRVDVTLRSASAQSLTFRSGVAFQSVKADDGVNQPLDAKKANAWRIELPVNRPIRFHCMA
jgi:hypothetical protein